MEAIATSPGKARALRQWGWLVGGVRLQVRRLAPLDAMSSDPAINTLLGEDPLIG